MIPARTCGGERCEPGVRIGESHAVVDGATRARRIARVQTQLASADLDRESREVRSLDDSVALRPSEDVQALPGEDDAAGDASKSAAPGDPRRAEVAQTRRHRHAAGIELDTFGGESRRGRDVLDPALMEPLDLLPAFRNETEANVDRAPPRGMMPDPRNAARQLLARTRYIRDPRDADPYQIHVDPHGALRHLRTGNVFDTTRMFPGVRGWDLERIEGRAMFTLATDGTLYASDVESMAIGVREWVQVRQHHDAGRHTEIHLPDVLEFWHHSSIVAGAAVLCAGEIGTDANGFLRFASNQSGHYRPGREHFLRFLERLVHAGVDMEHVMLEVVAANAPSRRLRARRFLDARGAPAHGPPAAPAFTGRY